MYSPPATAPVGMYNELVITPTSGLRMLFVARPKLAKMDMMAKSTVVVFGMVA